MPPDSTNPWDWMQPHDVARFGEGILDREQRANWCTAVFIGGLPYMWRHKAAPVRDMMYEKMKLKLGDRVLLIGESIPSCGFDADIRDRIGPDGELRVLDLIEQARDMIRSGTRGRGGMKGTWRYDYTSDVPDNYYDAIGVLQGVQHCDDWRETGTELVRVLKPGGMIMLGEIGFSPRIEALAECDLHLQYWLDKLLTGIYYIQYDEIPYYNGKALLEAFEGLLNNPTTFDYKGLEMFWGSKP